ncbi:hypothetical protein FDI24_gp019 [Acidovorax phage ACP17]|uniref:Uncharacterized protein n=1 Tax=Acidovorax phage ACP17 TaxID=2010329 RepID=A0A218M3C4_9CAUD|nr:hypothetical protein FDI24_gp019 [Acidovorax phage ACP17]ASD50553.1 hypothetical protein [Acidovorax phage ACP17]
MGIKYSVAGKMEFPLDMLRYDECEFEEDIDRDVAMDFMPPGTSRILNRIVRLVSKSGRHPTVGRWESFGWKVIKRPDFMDVHRKMQSEEPLLPLHDTRQTILALCERIDAIRKGGTPEERAAHDKIVKDFLSRLR